MINVKINAALLVVVCFFLIGITLVIKTSHEPIRDFGNYYYGSKLLAHGQLSASVYTDLGHFNKLVGSYGERNYFVNYSPVPPFSALFYLPFTLVKSGQAKVLFNVLGLFVFCFSLYRFIRKQSSGNKFIWLLPIVFLIPFYNTISQGQGYFLLTALLMEAFLAAHNQRHHAAAIFLALSISLKLFPVFMLLFFLLKKNNRVVIWTCVYTVLITLVTIFVCGWEIAQCYFLEVVPRLFNNDVIGAYHSSNQSIYSFLLNLFSFDALSNIKPVYNLPVLVPFIESLAVAYILSLLIKLRFKNDALLFGLCGLVLSLVSRYNPSYSLIMLVPFFVGMSEEPITLKQKTVLSALLALALFSSVGGLGAHFILIKFLRLILLLGCFLLFMFYLRQVPSLKTFMLMFLPLFALRHIAFSVQTINYFRIQNTQGILVGSMLRGDSLILTSTLGDKTHTDVFDLKGSLTENGSLKIENNQVVYKGATITHTGDNKLQAYLYKDSSVVVLSDLNQGFGFYKLLSFPIKK